MNVPNAGSWVSYTLGTKRYIHAGGQFNQYQGEFSKTLEGGYDEVEYLNTRILTGKEQ